MNFAVIDAGLVVKLLLLLLIGMGPKVALVPKQMMCATPDSRHLHGHRGLAVEPGPREV